MIRILLAALIALATVCPAFPQASQGITPCVQGGSVATTLAVTTSTNNVHLATTNCGPTVIVYNITSQEAFFNLGSASNTAATTSGWSLPGNTYVVLNVSTAGLYLAAITASSTTTLRIIQGRATT